MRLAGLCKGSTTDSDSVCEGSNPSPAAIKLRSSDRSFFIHVHDNMKFGENIKTGILTRESAVPDYNIRSHYILFLSVYQLKPLRSYIFPLSSGMGESC